MSRLPKNREKERRMKMELPWGRETPMKHPRGHPSLVTSSLYPRAEEKPCRRKGVIICIVNSQHRNVPQAHRLKLLRLMSYLPEITGLGDGIYTTSGSLVMTHWKSFSDMLKVWQEYMPDANPIRTCIWFASEFGTHSSVSFLNPLLRRAQKNATVHGGRFQH